MARKHRVLRRGPRTLLPSPFLIKALAAQGRRYECAHCGDTMFVRYESGLCPLCYNGRRGADVCTGEAQSVPGHLALAGVLDDPALES
ncbi:MAG: hypothetical protein JRH01_06045 [Deltaproteobacteria bacterium]|nr:hypothetical protein [Deltaproteobacteria bacterium]